MSVQISSNAVSVYWQNQTENLSELLKRLFRNIRCASRRYRVHNEYDRLNDPIISKAYSTMLSAESPCSGGPKRRFLR
ncbi:hypothetical protein GHT06_020101 [Daphnia sinensis]|uniref:Uncharacterized protein n=1 Tax=Daphnia sinensis TaxID=1820382 RepID=A0AAD5KL00_9CRUS|nr:hypothetical protein GHT06_020101 [Daphnia sinensis]